MPAQCIHSPGGKVFAPMSPEPERTKLGPVGAPLRSPAR